MMIRRGEPRDGLAGDPPPSLPSHILTPFLLPFFPSPSLPSHILTPFLLPFLLPLLIPSLLPPSVASSFPRTSLASSLLLSITSLPPSLPPSLPLSPLPRFLHTCSPILHPSLHHHIPLSPTVRSAPRQFDPPLLLRSSTHNHPFFIILIHFTSISASSYPTFTYSSVSPKAVRSIIRKSGAGTLINPEFGIDLGEVGISPLYHFSYHFSPFQFTD